MKHNNKKRQRLRIPFETTATLRFVELDRVLIAKMKNISMNGIFVETDKSIPIDTPCRIEVIITAKNSRITMETDGFVSRHDPDGLGVQFKDNIEWFAFFSIFEHYGRENSKD